MKVAIIPARGGSKRIPKKNIKEFFGKPIIAYSIDCAIKSNIFDKIIVSTDCDIIADIAKKYGAEVPFKRPKELSDDFTGTDKVVEHTVRWLEESNESIELVCCIYATAPLITPIDLKKGFELIKTNKWDCVFAATTFSYPIFRSFKRLKGGGLKMIFPEHFVSRSQDLEEAYHDAGQFYWAKSDYFKSKSNGFDENKEIVKLPSYRVQDIDTEEDWKRAEILYQSMHSKD